MSTDQKQNGIRIPGQLLKYGSVIISFLILYTGVITGWTQLKAQADQNQKSIAENKSELKEREPDVNSIPFLVSEFKEHKSDFKDYKVEQRSVNKEMMEILVVIKGNR